MKRFHMYVPKANEEPPQRDIIEEFVNLIPYGNENAIKRKLLVQKCIAHGLINMDLKDADRAMRLILKAAKIDYAICNIGQGYFRPTVTIKDKPYIDRYVAEQHKAADSIREGVLPVEKVQADINSGRLTE